MLIKKIFITLIILTLFPISVFSAGFPETSAKSSILLNADTNEVLYEKNAHEFMSMASTTKIMTSLLAVESGKMLEHITAEKDYNCEGTSISIKKGNTFTLETLIYAMLLESGNDAAELTADFLGGSQENFAEMMNEKAKKIGMKSTNFVTSSGLDADGHGTTAYDMAVLGSYAIKNPVFRKICSSEKVTVDYLNPDTRKSYTNHNRLLQSYSGIIGIKTGFTKKSGRCLVTACKRNGITLVAVTLKAPDDWNDHKKLYDYGFSIEGVTSLNVNMPSKITVYGSPVKSLSVKFEALNLSSSDKNDITYKTYLRKWLYAPIKSGDIVGYTDVFINNKYVKRINISATENAEIYNINNKPNFSLKYRLKRIFN
ncbi:MAG: D-alanyl-D-alanine carboxypeptidase family protein [Acutalibacteraceae bacterium]|nr:D-alanyl-D-alanine carboxypeptidase family protein [Acutalibacteraceae bacterium]